MVDLIFQNHPTVGRNQLLKCEDYKNGCHIISQLQPFIPDPELVHQSSWQEFKDLKKKDKDLMVMMMVMIS